MVDFASAEGCPEKIQLDLEAVDVLDAIPGLRYIYLGGKGADGAGDDSCGTVERRAENGDAILEPDEGLGEKREIGSLRPVSLTFLHVQREAD